MLVAGTVCPASPRYIISTQQYTSVEACHSISFSSSCPFLCTSGARKEDSLRSHLATVEALFSLASEERKEKKEEEEEETEEGEGCSAG